MGGVKSSKRVPLRNGAWSTMTWYTPSDLITATKKGVQSTLNVRNNIAAKTYML